MISVGILNPFASSASFDIMFLLTNCEVHKGKYSDRSFDEKLRSEYFPQGPN